MHVLMTMIVNVQSAEINGCHQSVVMMYFKFLGRVDSSIKVYIVHRTIDQTNKAVSSIGSSLLYVATV